MTKFLAIGECMVELADAGSGLYRRGFAGDTFNAAWYARRLLPAKWHVAYLSAVGDDSISSEMVRFIESEGIDTQYIRRLPGMAPGLYMISLNKGERSFSYWRDTSAAKQLASDGMNVQQALTRARIIYFSGITLGIIPPHDAERLLLGVRAARERGALVAFDTNFRPRVWKGRDDVQALMLKAAGVATLVLPGLDDEQAVFGVCTAEEAAQRYLASGAGAVIVKNGAEGATVFDGKTVQHVPAASPRAVVDTTAAGDSFGAAVLVHMAADASLTGAARYAAGIAAQVVAERGALVRVKG